MVFVLFYTVLHYTNVYVVPLLVTASCGMKADYEMYILNSDCMSVVVVYTCVYSSHVLTIVHFTILFPTFFSTLYVCIFTIYFLWC